MAFLAVLAFHDKNIILNTLGKDRCDKSEEFSEKFQRGVAIFNPKIYVADFGSFKQGMELIQKK